MVIQYSRRLTQVCLLFFIFSTSHLLFARDINLDEIYIDTRAPIYEQLINLKLNAYKIAKSNQIDTKVIFSGWSSGKRLVYVKEFKNSNINYIYEYFPSSRVRRKLHRIQGAIIYARLSQNGHYLFLKNMIINGTSIKNEIVIVNLRKNTLHTRPSDTLFTDFTLSFFGDSIYYETKRGICKYSPEARLETVIIPYAKYSHLFSQENKTLIFFSPMEDKILFINGGGGEYISYLYYKKRFSKVSGVTSARELTWIDNNHFIFRGGYIGNYQVSAFNSITKRRQLVLPRSLNTNITQTPYNNYITFLQDGIISFYYMKTNYLRKYPIEGEDVTFSPMGSSFSSLFNKNLYITNFSNIQSQKTELNKNARDILNLYKIISADHSIQSNSYSKSYLERKIAIYIKLMD